jgi:hypothetical protein
VVPNTAQNAYHTSETHALYKEGDIVGSKLPNLTTPPPEEDECAKIGAIILVVVVAIVAIVATVLTVGAAGPAAAAALGLAAGSIGAIAVSVAVGAVIGAAIAFAASAITQGILIGFGLQKSFDWKAVAADVVAGFFGGAAAGLGAAVSAARTLTTTVRVVNIVGQALLETAGEAASQAIQNDGKIVSPGLVVAAGAGAALGAIGDVAKKAQKGKKALDIAIETTDVKNIVTRARSGAVSGAKAVAESGQASLEGFSRRANRVFAKSGNITDNLAANVDDVAANAAMQGKSVFATVFND